MMALCRDCRSIFSSPETAHLLAAGTLKFSRLRLLMICSALDGCEFCREMLCLRPEHIWTTPDGDQVDVRGSDAYENGIRDDIPWPFDLWHQVLHSSRGLADASETDTRYFFRMERHPRDPNPEAINRLLVWRGLAEDDGEDLLGDNRQPVSYIKYDMATDQSDPALSVVGTSLPNLDLNAESTYHQIKQFLRRCDMKHASCSKIRIQNDHVGSASLDRDNSRYQPSRILSLVEWQSGSIRLEDFVSGTTYAALSYCWGAPQPQALTMSSLHRYKKGIEIGILPQTIQDAAVVAMRLGLTNLWVDSLCIIQDSDQDKLQELGKMASIYRSAYVTISAALASNCNPGFLDRPSPQRTNVTLPFCCPDGNLGSITLTPSQPFSERIVVAEPIQRRAWTFQERLISSRVISFNRQIVWYCCEDWGRDGGRLNRDHYLGFSAAEEIIHISRAMSSKLLLSPTVNDWHHIVQVFTGLGITLPEDRLPALSSLAEICAAHFGDEYVAGLWKSHLRESLVWKRGSEFGNHPTRPTSWRAPSWSFFSVEGRVDFFTPGVNSRAAKPQLVSLIDILDVQTSPMSSIAPFGQVSSGTLRVAGWLIKGKLKFGVSVREDEEKMVYFPSNVPDFQFSVCTDEFGMDDGSRRNAEHIRKWAYGDALIDTALTVNGSTKVDTVWGILEEPFDVLALPLLATTSGFGLEALYPDVSCLLLVKQSAGHFHRIGIISGNQNGLLRDVVTSLYQESSSKETLTIV